METIRVLEVFDELEALKTEVMDIYLAHKNQENQVILQTNVEGVEDWHTGVGQVEHLENKLENDYVHIQPSLKGSLLEKYITKYGGFRTRIMGMTTKSSYSVHSDFTSRVHIPIVTNFHAWMIWPHLHKCHHLRAGVIYWTDTTKKHTAINGSLTDERIHVVMCVDYPPT